MTTTAVPDLLAESRAVTLALVAPLSERQIETQYTPLMSPLAWDLAHIAADEDLWIGHRHGGLPLRQPELAAVYDAFETPRPVRGSLPLLDTAGARDYLDAVRERTLAVLDSQGPGDGALLELVLRHEQQHVETMLQAHELARIDGYERPSARRCPPRPISRSTRSSSSTFPAAAARSAPARAASPMTMSARATPSTSRRSGSAADHQRDLAALRRGRRLRAARMVVRRGLGMEGGVRHLPPRRLVRRRTRVADHRIRAARAGGAAPGAEHVTLGQDSFAPAPAGSLAASAAPSGCEQMIGDVWEWTATELHGYPGFTAHPYREYSEVFFGTGHRVLRGGSWATAARVATATFRNWDLPQRRQIFAGVRIAIDAGDAVPLAG